MKRSVCALMTAAVVGCQSPDMGGRAFSTAHSAMPTGVMGPSAKSGAAPAAMPAGQAVAAKTDMKYDPNIQQVGHNHGWGARQNNHYRERVAAAIPSHGGMGPGGFAPQMAPPGTHPMMGAGMMGGMAGCAADQMGGMNGMGLQPRFTTGRSQIRFTKPTGMKIAWQSSTGGDAAGFTAPQLEVPARFNFMQARIYRLKVTDIANRPGLELYPSLEVYPGNVKVDAFLAHNAIPIEITDEDFDQVQAGNYVTKVIYLPDPKFQELAIAGVETLVSTRLDPGVDPVAEAHRRGAILAVLRIGSVDLEMPHSPPLAAQAGPPAQAGSLVVTAMPEKPAAIPTATSAPKMATVPAPTMTK